MQSPSDLRIGIRDHAAPYDHVAETVHTRLANAEVVDAMSRLTDLQRQALELAYFDSLTMAEISVQLGVSVSIVKTRLRDGLIALRRTINQNAA